MLVIPRLERPPALEDFLEMKPNGDPAGSLAKVEAFIQRVPTDGSPASQRTEVYLGYDNRNLYVIFVAFDSEPDKIRARLSRRESIGADDTVGVILDTFHDQRRAYAFSANPLGIQADSLRTEGQGVDISFDTLWQSRGRLTDQGYVVWMAIPFKSLRFSSEAEQTWGIIFNRDIPRNNEETYWPHVSSRVQGQLNQAATMRGLANVSPGRNVQFIPYGAFRSFRAPDFRDPVRPSFVRDPADPDAGLDTKVVFKDSLVLDVALNPDFAQVESDEPQVTVNQRFEVFFPERRPFFLENASFFQTPINLFFTRRILDPQFGVRLTGKVGPYAIGAVLADDEGPGKSLLPSNSLHGKRARFTILRLSRDIFQQSSLGFIYTNREFGVESNYVGGVDGRLKLGQNWVAKMQGVASSTHSLDGSRLAGPAYDAGVSRSGRQLSYNLEYNDRGRGFRTLPGFLLRPDIRRLGQQVSYRFRPEGKRLISWGPSSNSKAVFDHSGLRLDLTQDTEISWELVGQTSFGFLYNWDRERLRPVDVPLLPDSRDFSRNRKGFFFNSNYFRKVQASGSYSWGTRINFVPPDDPRLPLPQREPVLASVSAANLFLSLRPLTPLRIDTTYIFSRLTDRARGTGANIFQNHILRSKWNWQFTRELSLRVILQYNSVLANPGLTSLATTKSLNADFLITYLLNPGTALYIGYNSNAQNLAPDLFVCQGPGVLRPGCPDLADANAKTLLRPRRRFINDARQFFVKFSYLLRF